MCRGYFSFFFLNFIPIKFKFALKVQVFLIVEMSLSRPARSASVTSEPSPRQSSRSRRRAGDSSDHHSPSELLKQIGLAGPAVVKVLKGRGWEICEPKGLEEHKRYYLPGCRAKGDSAQHGEDYLVGEGELYEYVLEKGAHPIFSLLTSFRNKTKLSK
eukprot:jgi/Phyca11/107845/e_gw1.14.441.1